MQARTTIRDEELNCTRKALFNMIADSSRHYSTTQLPVMLSMADELIAALTTTMLSIILLPTIALK